jgi:uncharacterized cupredoxin-like copper-binding protein
MLRRVPLVVLTMLLAATAAACAGSSSTYRTIAISMTDSLTFQPDSIEVKAGETVRFEVRNVGQIAHEFFVGSAAQQDEHEAEMRQLGSMPHDHPTGVHVAEGGSKTLVVTFPNAGTLLMGCHEPGHWQGGMRGTIVVTP